MKEKEQLVERFQELVGRRPLNLNEILSVLVHPSVISATKEFIQSRDHTTACKKFVAPWNCIRESEAYAQTVNEGWTGSMSEVLENWCVNCRARLYGDDPGDAVPVDDHWLIEDSCMEDAEEQENPWVVESFGQCTDAVDDLDQDSPWTVDGCGD